ncbi:hypothetical protein ElyMa_000289000 [Elysia marginata]|uniref:Single domain-containing protein n=1 Tax=Elysia marginata TaxID=1093978 RepID=A0AAV4F6A0_9GAST|nr:hypothetical protein ElyMa_000289000 [Elysia marginata]
MFSKITIFLVISVAVFYAVTADYACIMDDTREIPYPCSGQTYTKVGNIKYCCSAGGIISLTTVTEADGSTYRTCVCDTSDSK